MAAARPLGVPVLLGVLLLKSARMARFLNANIPGVQVPEALIARLEVCRRSARGRGRHRPGTGRRRLGNTARGCI